MKKTTFVKLGLVICLSLLALLYGINFLKGKGIFDNSPIYYIVYNRIDGLQISNPVLINGFKVGQVRQIKFTDDKNGKLIVEIALNNDYKLPQKTIARIFSSDLMGTKAIDLIMSDEKLNHNVGDTLIPDFEGSLQEMVSLQMLPLKNKAENLMKEMEEAIEIVKYIFNDETTNNISETFKNIRNTIEHLENSTSNLDSIVEGGKSRIENIIFYVESITNNLNNNNKAIASAINNVNIITDQVAKANIYNTISKTDSVMGQLHNIVSLIEQGQGVIGQLLKNDTLYYSLVDVSYNLNRLAQDIRNNPKRYIHFSAVDLGKTVIVDSYDEKGKKEKVLFFIQINESDEPIPLIPENFKGYKNINEVSVDGKFKYFYGQRNNLPKARKLLLEIQPDFNNAFIVEFSEGKYIKVN